MKRIRFFFLFLLICFSVAAQNKGNDAASIRAQMSAIRKSTNWSDPLAAKAANAKIQELAAKLTSALRQGKPQTLPPGSEGIKPEEAAKIQQENDDYSNKLWNQMMKIVQEGGKGKWDLAEPLREEIVEEYREDEDPTVKSTEWIQSMPYLLINMSMPHVQVVIDQMPVFRGVKVLVITTEEKGKIVDLDDILKKASEYPLEELYINNFGSSVSTIPSMVGNFSALRILSLYNNNIKQLPSSISKLQKLKTLQVDINPINSIIQTVNSLGGLNQLGIAKTEIPETEITRIQQALPNCKILRNEN